MKFEKMRTRRKSPPQPGDMSTTTAWLFVIGGAVAVIGFVVIFALAV